MEAAEGSKRKQFKLNKTKTPHRRGFEHNKQRKLTLGELYRAACFAQTDFLTFDFTRIAGDEARFT